MVMLVLLVWRGHSCPRNLATSTNSELRSGTSTAPKFKCATDPCRSVGIIVCEATPVSTASFRRYEYRRRLPHDQRDERPLSVTFRTSPRLHSLAKQERWFSNTVFMTTVRPSI
jgi:hypothetical protein